MAIVGRINLGSFFLLLSIALFSLASQADESSMQENVPDAIKYLLPGIKLWGSNPILVDAVKAHNNRTLGLNRIKKIDREWIAALQLTDIMRDLMANPAAKELLRLESSQSYYRELFLMDRRGAIVAMTNRTSDYWQGDEAKFTESFLDGAGAVHVNNAKFDESTNALLIQISVPIMDNGRAIGALTVGANLNSLLISKFVNKADSILRLTREEKEWLADNPDIRWGFGINLPPFLMRDKNGRFYGIYVDLMDALNQALGMQMTMEADFWPRIIQKANEGEIAAIPGTSRAGGKDRKQIVSDPITNYSAAIYSRADASFSIDRLEDIAGLRIVNVEDRAFTKEFLSPFRDNSEILEVANIKEAFKLLLENKADVFLGGVSDNYHISNGSIVGLQMAFLAPQSEPFGIGVRGDWPELVNILNKGLAIVGAAKINAIHARWLNLPARRQPVSLTHRERDWLNSHPDIRLGFGSGFEPFLILDDDGKQSGIIVDLMAELNRQLLTDISIEVAPMSEVIEKTRQRQLDGLLAVSDELVDSLQALSTNITLSANPAAYSRTDSLFPIEDWSDLARKRVVLVKGRAFSQRIVDSYAIKSEIIVVPTVLEALNLVVANKADVFVGALVDNYHIGKNVLPGITISYIDPENSPIRIAIRSDWPELVGIINKGLNAIGEKEVTKLSSHWLDTPDREMLSAEERRWLKSLAPLKIAVLKDLSPFENIGRDGLLGGITGDYANILAQRLRISIDPVPVQNPAAIHASLLNGEVDMSLVLSRPERHAEQFSYSRPFLSIPLVVVTQRDKPLIQSLKELDREVVAVVDQSPAHHVMQRFYAEFPLVLVANIAEGLRAVSDGEVHAMLGNSASVDFWQRQLDIRNLKTVHSTEHRYEPVITLRKELAPLIPILYKALNAFTKQEKKLIFDKWVNPPIPPKLDLRSLTMWGALIFSVVAAIIIWQQRKIRQSQEKAIVAFETTLRVKNDFLTAISHELRTPMNAIIGGLQVAQEHPLEHLRSPLDVVQGGARDMMRLISDILAYVEIQADECRLHAETCSLPALLRQLYGKYQLQCIDNNLTLEWSVDKGMPEWLVLDDEKIQTVIEKVMDNAVKFTDEGSIFFEARCEESSRGLQLVVKIEDSGIGIPDADKSSVFEAFTQMEGGFHRRFGGTGIGLSICKHLVATMGGTIYLDSTVGKGSCFTINVPVKKAERPKRTEGTTLASSLLPILVVEDNQFNQIVLQKMLEKLGYRSVLAGNGQKALEILNSEAVSLVLMDLQMQVMDGFVCTEKIREREDDSKNIPIIAVTANFMDNNRERCTEIGMNGFIKKPVKLDILAETLLHYIEPPVQK